MSSPETSDAWYAKDGLRFTCTQCGNCCTGPPGYVWFTDEEAAAMAEYVGVDVETFRDKYARKVGSRWTLEENLTEGGKYDCVFLAAGEDGKRGCSIYSVRPLQCRTWPYWPENIKSPRAWARVAQVCPGVNNGTAGQGQLYSVDEIRVIRDKHG